MIGCRKGRWYPSNVAQFARWAPRREGLSPPRLARCYRPCVACRLRDKSPSVEISEAGSRFRVGMEMAQGEGRQTASPPPKPERSFSSWSMCAGPRLTPVPPAPGPAGPSRNRFAVRGHQDVRGHGKETMTEPKVTIRPLRIGDEPAVQRYASDERVARTTTIPEPYPEDGAATFVQQAVEARRKREGFSFAIVADREMIGVVGLGAIDLGVASILRTSYQEWDPKSGYELYFWG